VSSTAHVQRASLEHAVFVSMPNPFFFRRKSQLSISILVMLSGLIKKILSGPVSLLCVGVGGRLLGLVLEAFGFKRVYLPCRPLDEHDRPSIFGFFFPFGLFLSFFVYFRKRGTEKKKEEMERKSLHVALVKENSTKE
jgi:hypothetical protein